jgi:hypothetical protein
LIELYRFDFSKIILNVDEILVTKDRDHKCLVVLKECVAKKSSWG